MEYNPEPEQLAPEPSASSPHSTVLTGPGETTGVREGVPTGTGLAVGDSSAEGVRSGEGSGEAAALPCEAGVRVALTLVPVGPAVPPEGEDPPEQAATASASANRIRNKLHLIM